MIVDEETILSTLFALTEQVTWRRSGDASDRSFLTRSRRVKLFSDVSLSEQPACFQAEHGTTEEQVTGMPYKSVIEAAWVIYQAIAQEGPQIEGTVENNLILGGVRAALAPSPRDPGFFDKRNTLGGIVHHCFISGRVFKDPGDIDGQGMLVVPIKVLVP